MKRRFCIIAVISIVMLVMPMSSFAGFTEGTAKMKYRSMTIPKYDGDSYETVNGGKPSFTSEELKKAKKKYEKYSKLDSLGRAGIAEASLNESLMPDYARGSISSVYPTGWMQNRYSFVSGGWLYNRAHLIGFQLTGVDNEHRRDVCAMDLVTGTRQMNVGSGSTGMVKFENMVAGYLRKNPKKHILYRVSPVYGKNNLLSYGVLMEARCPEDTSVGFCVFCYNVQDGVSIDYRTGDNTATPGKTKITKTATAKGKIAVAYKAVSGAKGYQIVYRKAGKSKWSFVVAKGTKKTVTGLSDVKYQVAVRAYKVYSGSNVFGKFSKVKTVKP